MKKCLFIVSRILWKKVTQSKYYEREGVALRIHPNTDKAKEDPNQRIGTLSWYFGGEVKKVSNMVHSLIEWQIIDLYKEAEIGESARRYKLSERFGDSKIKTHSLHLKDGKFVEKLLQHQNRNSPLVQAVLNTYENHVTLSEEGFRYLEAKYSRFAIIGHVAEAHRQGWFNENREALSEGLRSVIIDPADASLFMLFSRSFYASISPKNGRLNHNLTSLKREHRKYLLINGNHMHEIDISNSQPTFSIPVIRQKISETNGSCFSEDMLHYEALCCTCTYYEAIAKEAGIDISTHEGRAKFKEDLYAQVFYCKNNNWNTPIQVAFRSLFPNVYRAIWKLKVGGHQKFALCLQEMESRLMIEYVYQRLVNEGRTVLPLHDAIYCPDEETKAYAKELIKHMFKEMHELEITFKEDVYHEKQQNL
jgi:hypothetical protein